MTTITITDQAASVISQRAMRARVQLANLRDADGPMFTAVELADTTDLDAIEFADAFALDLDYEPGICTKNRVHPAHGIYAITSSRPVEGSTIGAVVETHRLIGQCAGLDVDTWFERTQDAQ